MSRRRWVTWLAGAVAVLLVAYGGLIAYLVANQTELIFRPRRAMAMVPMTSATMVMKSNRCVMPDE